GASFGLRKEICYNDRPVSWGGGYSGNLVGLRFVNTSTVKAPTEMAVSEALCECVFKIWEKEKCTVCSLNPVLVQKLLTGSMHMKYDLSNVSVFTMFGQRYSLDTVAALIKIFPKVAIVVLYASSESWLLAKMIVNKETAVEEKYAKLTIEEGVEVKIVDEESKLVSRGTPGEICARKASVFLEYLGNPEATKRTKSSTGWVHMGDTGIMYNDGKIEVIGRKTEIIKRATVKIFPAHIEKVLLQHPQVSDVVVVGIPDQQLHEEVCACVILREDTESDGSDEEAKVLEIREWCKRQWPPGPDGLSMTPRYFLPMKNFPVLERAGKTFVRGVKDYALKKLTV
ncbi:4-coumarate--CoA ligase 1, partial [Exaiptasia diaphana]|uniref:Uncharacterized protein n=1 Tax=Exaiptasia diaphana TaxID=2652724 RepID=A0A913XU10_EXADI